MPNKKKHDEQVWIYHFRQTKNTILKKSRIRRNMLKQRRNFDQFLRLLMCIAAFVLFIGVCNGGKLSESESLISFIEAVDPKNELNFDRKNGLVTNLCLHNWKGVICNLDATTITEIWLDNMNLSGIIDANSLCNLPNLHVLNLAKNQIHGKISDSISRCTRLTYINLSNNMLNGSVPIAALVKLKNLRRLDISRNRFSSENVPRLNQKSKIQKNYFVGSSALLRENGIKEATEVTMGALSPSSESDAEDKTAEKWTFPTWIPLVIGITCFFLFAYFVNKMASKSAKDREILKFLAESPAPKKFTPAKDLEEAKPLEDKSPDLFFFVEEKERFKMADLLEAEADLQSQGLCSSLYKVRLKNNDIFAVKRLKQLPVSFEEFGLTMRKIGKMKHQNIIPLVAYGSTSSETKLLIYKFQKNGSLLSLLEKYTEGKRDFPWKTRLSIAIGIARGLEFIYQRSEDGEIIPHGNIKLSNILLNENEAPLISEYGCSKFLDQKKSSLFNSNGYTAPEKTSTEQGDVFSFGVILLELLTGKIVEKSGLDLPKWVRAMVREEWTGEVFDKEIAKVGKYAFPLLNISLNCVAHSPEDRPSIAEVLEKIEEVANLQEDFSPSSITSIESTPQCLLHSVVPEDWDSPGSNQ